MDEQFLPPPEEAFRDPHFWVRFVEMIFALTAFSVVAEGNGASQINYCIFCGVTTFVFGLLFIACYLADVTWARGLVPMVIDAIWWLFWLACAGALSAELDGYRRGEGIANYVSKARLSASVAFSWMIWFLYWADLYFDGQDWKYGGRSIRMPPLKSFMKKSGSGVQMAGAPPGAPRGAVAAV